MLYHNVMQPQGGAYHRKKESLKIFFIVQSKNNQNIIVYAF